MDLSQKDDKPNSSADAKTSNARRTIVRIAVVAVIALLPVTYLNWKRAEELSSLQDTSLFDFLIPKKDKELELKRSVLGEREPAELESLTPEFYNLLDQLESSLEGLDEDVQRVEDDRRQADPHLDKALRDFRRTPLAGANPRLAKDVDKELLDVLEKLIDDYAQHSKDSSAYKAKLIPTLRTALTGLWTANRNDSYEKIVSLANDKSDAIIWYCVAIGMEQNEEYLAAARKAHAAMKSRKVHPILGILIATKLLRFQTEVLNDERGLAIEESIRSMADIFQRYQDDPILIKFAFSQLIGLMSQMGGNAKVELTTQFAKRQDPPLPPWIIHYCVSRVCSAVSATYRGGTFMSKVTPENRRRFIEFAEMETAHLKKSWTLAPDHAGIPTALMSIETRASATGRTADAWFRHALSAQLDYYDVLEAYTMECEARWGGSDAKLLWLANKLADCSGLESDIALFFWYPIQRYSEDYSNTISLARPEVVAATLKVLEQLKQRDEAESVSKTLKTGLPLMARILWDAGKLEELRWFLKRYEKVLENGNTHYYRLDLPFVKEVCHASQGEAIDCWQTIVDDLLIGSRNLDTKQLDRLKLAMMEASALAKDDLSRKAVDKANKLLTWIEVFLSGETVELDFTTNADGWMTDVPFRVVDRTTIEFDIEPLEKKRLLAPLISLIPGSGAYSIEAEVFLVRKEGAFPQELFGVAVQAGPAEACDLNLNTRELRYTPFRGTFLWDVLPRNTAQPTNLKAFEMRDTQVPYTLRIDYSPTKITAFVNGEEVTTERGEFQNNGIFQIGRQAVYSYSAGPSPNVTYRISNIRLRKLDLE